MLRRVRGPIPESQIDPLIARDSELDWQRILNKPATFPPEYHTHIDLVSLIGNQTITGTKIFSPANSCAVFNNHVNAPSNSYLVSQAYFNSALEIRSVNNGPAYFSLHRPGLWATFIGLDIDNEITFGGWSSVYSPIKTGLHRIIGNNGFNTMLWMQNTAKTQNQKDRYVVYNSGANESWFPPQGGLHFYSYSLNGAISNPFSIWDDDTINIRARLRLPDGTFQTTAFKDIDWQTPTLINFANNQNYQSLRVGRLANIVYVSGTILNTVSLTANVQYGVFTLPENMRPAFQRRFNILQSGIQGGGSPASCIVVPNGGVSVVSNGAYSINNSLLFFDFAMPL